MEKTDKGFRDWFVCHGVLMPPSTHWSWEDISRLGLLFCPDHFTGCDPERNVPAFVRKAMAPRWVKNWVE